jgi:hypothetical protein
MFALDAGSRTALAAAAFTAFGAAFVTTPIVARGDAGVVAIPIPSAAPLPAATPLADVVPRRDPFDGGDAPATRPNSASPQTSIAMPALPPLPQIPAALRPLPPNAGAGDTAFPFAAGARTSAVITAVITGPHPFALIDEGGATRVLTIGDRIDGEPIVAIDADGVHLSGGMLLAVARASETRAASPLPARIVAPANALPPHARPTPGGHT